MELIFMPTPRELRESLVVSKDPGDFPLRLKEERQKIIDYMDGNTGSYRGYTAGYWAIKLLIAIFGIVSFASIMQSYSASALVFSILTVILPLIDAGGNFGKSGAIRNYARYQYYDVEESVAGKWASGNHDIDKIIAEAEESASQIRKNVADYEAPKI